MKIGLDVDGVLADLHTPWIKWGNEKFGTDHKEFTGWDQPTEWWGPEGYGFLTPEIYLDGTVRALPGALATVHLLRAKGHEIRFVTSCVNGSESAKKFWLRTLGFLKEDHEFIPSHDKSDAPVDVLVDDGFHNVRDFKRLAILVDSSHNRHEVWPNRVDSIANVPDMFDTIAGTRDWMRTGPSAPYSPPPVSMRRFESGATRNVDDNRLDFEAFLSPAVIQRYGEFMHKNRIQADGTKRDGDNWQKGIPLTAYMKSGWRHFMEWWTLHRSDVKPAGDILEDTLCALLFNISGYLYETIKARQARALRKAATQ